MKRRRIVLDANILIRAVLGKRVEQHCPIWTEDRDYFGAGVATWTSDLVEIYLRGDGAAGTVTD